ncbi:hypothetical protein KL928_004531 [Ogataea angusta]|uniref:BED-type domain-containing protein n=1 Tax=Pichia angusta TaxID=870730 RepID=A0AAN6DDF9_PICAN|nr:uncharacterized protein KL928_004531 [Ogataea angusta]KAG7816489.1 hypothetical protein KL928_004531 [Ogataea angusta]
MHCDKTFRYSSRNGPTNLARHINKTHRLGQPESAITRRPFGAAPNDLVKNADTQRPRIAQPQQSPSQTKDSSTESAASGAADRTGSLEIGLTTPTDLGPAGYAAPNSMLQGNGIMVNNGAASAGGGSTSSASSNGHTGSLSGHDYSDSISRSIAIQTPLYRLAVQRATDGAANRGPPAATVPGPARAADRRPDTAGPVPADETAGPHGCANRAETGEIAKREQGNRAGTGVRSDPFRERSRPGKRRGGPAAAGEHLRAIQLHQRRARPVPGQLRAAGQPGLGS